MNKRQRKEYSDRHLRLERQLENKHVAAMTRILKKQVSSFITDLKRNGVRAAVNKLQQQVYDPAVTVQLQKLYLEAVPKFGMFQYRNAIDLAAQPVKKESAAFGFSEGWNYSIIDFLSMHLLDRAVVPVSATTRKLIMDVLEQGQQQGWGIERIVIELGKVDEMAAWRARRIIRTELGIASNFGTNLAREELEFETQEEWITCRDDRVRNAHKVMDGVLINTGDVFMVPIFKGTKPTGLKEPMTGPGDRNASAGNVINCRCTRALIPKRDSNDELIMKPAKITAPVRRRV